MLFNSIDVAKMFIRFVGDNPPCNYNDLDEDLPEYCEMACGEATYLQCWVRFIEEKKI